MDRHEILPRFFILEGLDGSGTTTQLRILEERYHCCSTPLQIGWEPTDGPIGLLIRRILSGEVPASAFSLAHLFVADRYEHTYGPGGIVDTLRQGIIYVCDRYFFSSLAYQSVDCGFDFVSSLNSAFPLPEKLFFLEVPAEICAKRIAHRTGRDIFDELNLQKKIETNYQKALDLFSSSQMQIIRIDGTASPEKVHNQVWKNMQ